MSEPRITNMRQEFRLEAFSQLVGTGAAEASCSRASGANNISESESRRWIARLSLHLHSARVTASDALSERDAMGLSLPL